MGIKKGIIVIFISVMFSLLFACGTSSDTTSPTPSIITTINYEKIVEEALANEHDHVWVFDHYKEVHPHGAVYKCECDATFFKSGELADFTMKIIGPSEKHPHYMLEECSICHQQFENENLPTKITLLLYVYQDAHPHYAIIKCSQCDYTYIEYNTTAASRDVCKLQSTTHEEAHPHYLIFECTYKGCDYSFTDKRITAEFELETDDDNYGIAHPHYLYGSCSIDGCDHQEATSDIANWSYEDGVCSICVIARNVTSQASETSTTVTGLINNDFSGELLIPDNIEGKSVEIIGIDAFTGNNNITTVTIPDSVTIIEDRAFENCTNLQLLSQHICPLCGIESGIRTEPICQLCGLLTEGEESGYKVGNIGMHVSFIGEGAFRNNIQLKVISIGSHIQEIRDFAFEGCSNLTHVSITSMVAPQIGIGVFDNVSSNLNIFVPIGAVGYDVMEWEQYTIVYVDFIEKY